MSPSRTLLSRLHHICFPRRPFSNAVKYTARDRQAVTVHKPTGVRILTLKKNEPHGLATVDFDILRSIQRHVRMWEENYMVTVSFITGPDGSFCNGLDLEAIRGHPKEVRLTLGALRDVVTEMRSSKMPVVTIIDGPCYGSGYALASGKYKVCTENSMFCVPEATLGLGLAGGLSYVLPRLLDGNEPLALCLALTGMALEGADLVSAQLATNYMTQGMIESCVTRLGEIHLMPSNPFGETTHDAEKGEVPPALWTLEISSLLSWNVDEIDTRIGPSPEEDGSEPHLTSLHRILPQIERVFAVDSVEEAQANLAACQEGWAQMVLQNMDRSSPLSLKIIFEQIKRGAKSDIEQCLEDEYTVNSRLFSMPDFEQAMQARGDVKGKGLTWRSGSLESVSKDQVSGIFEPLSTNGESMT